MKPGLKLFGRGDPPDWSGFLDHEARVEGTLEAPGTFRLDGSLQGRIRSGRLLVLGATADVEGEIEGRQISIYGHFRGTLRATDQVEIHTGATVTGDVYTPCLVLDPGGRFDGHCYLNPAGAESDPLAVPIRGVSHGESGS